MWGRLRKEGRKVGEDERGVVQTCKGEVQGGKAIEEGIKMWVGGGGGECIGVGPP